ncbi:MAG: S1 RNA-binding domain-containing protein [Firmicutes bacterium]|jgi:S1 RNA binding domain protein|nr:S1 RNA-binding domain-containing protein [Bacillota bacterium]
MTIEVGSIVEGKVTGITHFGAFVQLADGKTGLVHISEVADAYVKDINDYLKENDIVKVKVINISEGKIGLSIKRVDKDYNGSSRPRGSRKSFEDRLARFLKESDERQQDLRRSMEAKRGGRGAGPRGF